MTVAAFGRALLHLLHPGQLDGLGGGRGAAAHRCAQWPDRRGRVLQLAERRPGAADQVRTIFNLKDPLDDEKLDARPTSAEQSGSPHQFPGRERCLHT